MMTVFAWVSVACNFVTLYFWAKDVGKKGRAERKVLALEEESRQSGEVQHELQQQVWRLNKRVREKRFS